MPPAKKSTKKTTSKPTKSAAQSFLERLKKEQIEGDIHKAIDIIPSGSWVLNRLIGDGTLQDQPGGFPRGYTVEIFGDEACGKTTIALHAAKEVQKAGGTVLFADFEHSLRTQKKYIENLGINIDQETFIHMTPMSFEQGAKLIGQSLMEIKPWLIIIDSVTAMIPRDSAEGDADEVSAIGKQARLMSHFLNWITKRLENSNTCLMLLNQKRKVIKKSKYDSGPDETTSGGNAVRFFSNVRIELRPKQKEKALVTSNITGAKEEKIVNQVVKATVVKNKLDLPFKTGPIYITFGKGINNILSLVELGKNKKVIKLKGAWFSWEDPNGEYSFNCQGKEALLEHLENNPEILKALQTYLKPTQNIDEMKTMHDELLEKGIENLTDDERDIMKDLRSNLGLSDDILNEGSDIDPDAKADLDELESLMGEKND